MEKWSSVDDALDFAIKNEEEAYEFYTGLAAKATDSAMKTLFEGFAKEEQGHKARLLSVKEGGGMKPAEKAVMDLKISDYLVDVEPDDADDFQAALILAMKKEKAAFKLYTDLARTTHDDGLRETFRALAQEEAKHKLRFEIEYDDKILQEN